LTFRQPYTVTGRVELATRPKENVIAHIHGARVETLGLDKIKIAAGRDSERWLATADHQWMDDDVILVDEICLKGRGREFRATDAEEIQGRTTISPASQRSLTFACGSFGLSARANRDSGRATKDVWGQGLPTRVRIRRGVSTSTDKLKTADVVAYTQRSD
jgi:hypothetical protein